MTPKLVSVVSLLPSSREKVPEADEGFSSAQDDEQTRVS
jgi:hypothetical protein